MAAGEGDGYAALAVLTRRRKCEAEIVSDDERRCWLSHEACAWAVRVGIGAGCQNVWRVSSGRRGGMAVPRPGGASAGTGAMPSATAGSAEGASARGAAVAWPWPSPQVSLAP